MEMDGAPTTAGAATQDGDDGNLVGCNVLDKYTAKCRLFGKGTTSLEENSLLMLGSSDGIVDDVLHHVVFVAIEVYRDNLSTGRQELFTEIKVFVDGKAKEMVYFRGQMRYSSAYISVLPTELLPAAASAGAAPSLAAFLSASKVSDVRYYTYPVPDARIRTLTQDGIQVASR